MQRALRRQSTGFTLLEILTVLIIVGVIVSVATISVGVLGRDSEMREQAERVWAVLKQAKEECELQGFDVGMRVGLQSYDFLRFDSRGQTWEPIANDDLFSARQLPDGLRFRLWIEGREVILSERRSAARTTDASDDAGSNDAGPSGDSQEQEPPPHIMVLSSGDVNSFEMQLERDGGNTRWKVFSKPDGSIEMEPVDDSI
jgi:general secretion pathway protein H